MKKFFLSLTLSILPLGFAQADIIRCTFTEPFAATTYSMAQQSLTIETPEGKRVIRNVSFQIKGPARFDIMALNGKVLQRLVLSHRGSDGMSDRVYPYEVRDRALQTNGQSLTGGCTSNYLHARPGTRPGNPAMPTAPQNNPEDNPESTLPEAPVSDT